MFSLQNNSYKIVTTEGKLQELYSRNRFEVCKEWFSQIKMVPNTVISLRETARNLSNQEIQGYTMSTTESNNVKQVNVSLRKIMCFLDTMTT